MNKQTVKVNYRGSLFWLIFWTICFFPIAIVLFFLNAQYVKDGAVHSLRYQGSKFWLCFWILLFFPVALILFFVNGFSLETRD
jgi:uncharacterized membrane protein